MSIESRLQEILKVDFGHNRAHEIVLDVGNRYGYGQ